jgi:Poly(ADP-ribose) polymerase catalytic domain
MCYQQGEVIVLLDDDDMANRNDDGKDEQEENDRKLPAKNGRQTDVIYLLDDEPRNYKKKKQKNKTTTLTRQQSLVWDLTSDVVVNEGLACAFTLTRCQRTLRQIRRQQRLDEDLARALQKIEDDNYVAVEPEATYDVLQWHRQNVQEMIKTQAANVQIVATEENPHAKVGSKLYNRFVEAWQLVQDQTVVLAFHGTAEANIGPICEYGLDPTKRAGQARGPGEYFARLAVMSLHYCKGGKKMLIVAVLVDKTGLTTDQLNVLVIHKPEHQLPLFVITLA